MTLKIAIYCRISDDRGGTGLGVERQEIEECEAIALREVVQRFLAKEGSNSLSRWLNDEEITTPAGRPFRAKALRDNLLNPRNCCQRSYKGEIVAPAQWPAIIFLEEGEAIREVLNSRKRLEAPVRTNLLLGLMVCGICGKKLVTNNKDGYRRYICRKDAVLGRECGGIFVTAQNVKDFVVEAVLTRLNSPEMERSLTQSKPNPKALALNSELAGLNGRYTELAEMLGQGEMTREYQVAKRLSIIASHR